MKRRWDYASYIQSERWRQRRQQAIARAGGCCQVCNSHGPLDVHHREYRRLGYERAADLIFLCADCHALYHKRLRAAVGVTA